MVRGNPQTERMFIGGDFNSHIRSKDSYDDMHGVLLMGLEAVEGSPYLSFQ